MELVHVMAKALFMVVIAPSSARVGSPASVVSEAPLEGNVAQATFLVQQCLGHFVFVAIIGDSLSIYFLLFAMVTFLYTWLVARQ